MAQLLRSIRLTNNMKKVMAKIVAAPTPAAAATSISQGQNLVAARDILAKIGLITFDEEANQAQVTDTGQQVMRDENLTDESGQLTQDGQQIAYDGAQPGTIDTNAPGPTDLGGLGGTPDLSMGAPQDMSQQQQQQPPQQESTSYGLLQILNS